MNIDQIIGKLMGDGSVEEEKSALEAWKKEAEDNIKALEDIRRIESLSNTLKGYEDFDVENAWDSFYNKMDSDVEEPKKEARLFSMTNLGRIAAILVLVVGSVFVFNSYDKVEETPELLTYTSVEDKLNIDLEDGTKVTMDKNSNLKVLDNRSVDFVGRAHFDVERVETKQFEINLPVGNVVVLGTEFTIDANENTTEVYVSEGSVRYELENSTYILVEGDLVKVVNNEVVILKGKGDNYDSWKNNVLMFRDNNMVEVVEALSRHFKKDVIIEDEQAFAKCNVVNVFTNATLDDILNDLSKSHTLKYHIRDKKIFIVSAKC